MKTLKIFGGLLVLSAFLAPVFAEDSTITDKASGMATNIVETGNVIHVYTYKGASPEATLVSTFNEGETWFNTSWAAKPRPIYATKPASARSNATITSDYVQAIDDCVASGKLWSYRDDMCH